MSNYRKDHGAVNQPFSEQQFYRQQLSLLYKNWNFSTSIMGVMTGSWLIGYKCC